MKELKAKLVAKVREIKDAGLLPRGYSKVVIERLAKRGVIVTESSVYNTISKGSTTSSNTDILKELVELAKEYNLEEMIETADRVLEKGKSRKEKRA